MCCTVMLNKFRDNEAMHLNELREANVLEALRVCFDPELAVNIVDLGLVDSITLERDVEAPGTLQRHYVRLTLLTRTQDDERNAMLHAQIENRLMGMPEVSRVTIHVPDGIVWSARLMSAAARRQLGLDRASDTGLVQIKMP